MSGSTPTTPYPQKPSVDGADIYLAKVENACWLFVNGALELEPVRSADALSDYTDMTCVDDFGLPGLLPQFWAVKMCEVLNGPNWEEWVHPNYPWIDGCYVYIYCTMVFHFQVGCDYMTYMVESYELHGIDIPNGDEWEKPSC